MCFQVKNPNAPKQTNKRKKIHFFSCENVVFYSDSTSRPGSQSLRIKQIHDSQSARHPYVPAPQATFSVFSPVTYLVGSLQHPSHWFPIPGSLTQTSPSKQDVLLGSLGVLPSKAKPGGWGIQVVGTPPHCRWQDPFSRAWGPEFENLAWQVHPPFRPSWLESPEGRAHEARPWSAAARTLLKPRLVSRARVMQSAPRLLSGLQPVDSPSLLTLTPGRVSD